MNSAISEAPYTIKVASRFSRTPGGRYYTDGPASGQQFREEVLKPALEQHSVVEIDLDGARGYPSSFLEEAFGGLVRELSLTPAEFDKRIRFRASNDFRIYIDDIKFHVNKAADGKRA